MKISNISVKRPSIVVVIFSILIVLGIVSYRSLNYELMPKYSAPFLSITTIYPGASPAEVENSVTKPIEEAISSLANINGIKSISLENFSVISIELKMSADVQESVQQTQRKVNSILSALPKDARTPVVNTFAIDEFPILRIGVNSLMEETEFYDLVKNVIVPRLSRLDGVAQIEILGGHEREIQVNVFRQKLQAHQISLPEIIHSIGQANISFPTGKIKDEKGQAQLRLSGTFRDINQIRNLIVRDYPGGGTVKIRDVADIKDARKDVEEMVRVNGQYSIGLLIRKQTDANAVAVSRLVHTAIERLEKEHALSELRFTIAQDSSRFTMEAVKAVNKDLINAVILVSLVMLIFLHSFRSAFFVLISIPTSLISTFIALQIFDFTLNLMTLLSLSLVVGILVDDSIIVLENVYRHLKMGKNTITAVLDGVKEVGITVISTSAVLVIVFLPLSMIGGIISMLLRQFSIIIVVATIMSSFVALMIIPALTSRFSSIPILDPKRSLDKLFLWFEAKIDAMGAGIVRMLILSFRRPSLVFIIATALFLFALALIPLGFIGDEFINIGDRGEFIIEVELPNNVTIEENGQVSREIEKYLMQKPEVTTIFTTVGLTSNVFLGHSTSNLTEMNVQLVSKDERDVSTNIYARRIKNDLENKFPGVKITSVPSSILGTADEAPIMLDITAPTTNEALAFGEKLRLLVDSIPGTIEEKLSIRSGTPELSISVDREKMKSLGLSLAEVGVNLQAAFSGNTDLKFRDGNYEYDINIRLDDFDRRDRYDVESLPLINNRGEVINLGQFADIKESTSPSRLERKNRMASVTLQAQAIGRPSGNIGADIKKALGSMDIPKDISISFEGDLKFQEDAFGRLGLAFLVSIIFVYLIMVALYDSYLHPFVVLFSIPLAIIGALLCLAMANQSLSIFSLLGIIMLVGLVTKNTILIVDFTNELRRKGYGIAHALLCASRLRLRPILMTALSLIIALFPIALAKGAGSEWKNGLAWVLIGGLTSSLFLSLIFVPVAYLVLENFVSFVKRIFVTIGYKSLKLKRQIIQNI